MRPEPIDGTLEIREIRALNRRIDEIQGSVDTALRLLKEHIETTLADIPGRVSQLEQIIEPLRLTPEDVANGVELRMRSTDGRMVPIAAADVANAILAGKRVVKLVPQVVG